MTRTYKFEGSKAKIDEEGGRFVASCRCGWRSDAKATVEEAIIDFETHVGSDPRHRIVEEKLGVSFSSLLLAALGFLYIVSPIDFVPDYLIGVGWLEDILIGIMSFTFAKEGMGGKSPLQVLSDVFG